MADEAGNDVAPPSSWDIYKRRHGLVLAFHGCDKATADRVLSGSIEHLLPSKNQYDWLGGGIYFWEEDPWRALQWANEARARPSLTSTPISDPYVIGAVLDMGHCLNLLEFGSTREVSRAFRFISEVYEQAGQKLPTNVGGKDRLRRFLDKVVIDALHRVRVENQLAPYDSVRAMFMEGDDLYDGAGFKTKNHIQIAVLNERCIKGYFRLPGL